MSVRLGGCSRGEGDLVDSRGRSLLDQVPVCVIGQCRGFRSRSRQPFGHHVVQWQGVRIHDAMSVRQRLRPVVEDVGGRSRRCDRAERRARSLDPDSGVLDGYPDHGVGVNVVCRRIPGTNAHVQHPSQGTLEYQSVPRFSIHRHCTGRRRVGCRLPRSLATRQHRDQSEGDCRQALSRATQVEHQESEARRQEERRLRSDDPDHAPPGAEPYRDIEEADGHQTPAHAHDPRRGGRRAAARTADGSAPARMPDRGAAIPGTDRKVCGAAARAGRAPGRARRSAGRS